MNIDIKNLEEQDMKQLVKSLELVSARILDSVVKTSQLAGGATQEMQLLFDQWIECLGGALTDAVDKDGAIIPEKLAQDIGVTPTTIISLALALHRMGKIKITEVKAAPANGENTEICGCLK
ncbi:hypothetical protein [Synergistes jonesii]|uniref:Uncharacterized protein n=1 Tax=Synergistes jonesii TaxID=2754 RepID=A0A073ISE6_9BACT|nr:hypothetical protein [Synergistes jonesii]KEJ92714.1 hypothetical protein EH55_02845 [Synergistes jonesii]OFB63614.1 hypothetical protein JS73_05260 [Synergistes jonesii]OFB63898.1 hypothetical protein JS72_06465 [Synergistes jonesii]OFB64429.1 hypothetical protein JS79_05810 [Synergistes jonesii]OFB68064.1 hypothetical protein JS78_05275 [Synergistes jonesii]